MQIIQDLSSKGAEAALLGCTELGSLITSEDVKIPIYDTTRLHAKRAALWSVRSKGDNDSLQPMVRKALPFRSPGDSSRFALFKSLLGI